MATVVLLGTLDTKGAEYAWLAERLRGHGVDVVTVDVGPLSDAAADVTAAEVARAAGADLAALRAAVAHLHPRAAHHHLDRAGPG
ncbi:Tm-1-like ATP-binding domain-containing protein, partial [Streptomyces ardesiacus]|uniref:Tm-1-like ATP-binding domain-containing protein n=1 Tax=Streptomyces ardesiacus TaxID=285564 RepID=UPI00364B299F